MRIVNLAEHPANLAVFTASSMKEALPQAEAAFREPGIQGAVWYQPPEPSFAWERESVLMREFRQAIGQTQDDSRRFDVQVVVTTNRQKNQSIGLGASGRISAELESLEQSRLDNLKQLSNAFSKAHLSIRHEKKGDQHPHYDGDGIEPVKLDRRKIFSGQNIRVLRSRTVAGTWVYDLEGRPFVKDDLPEAWEVGIGSYLFLTGSSGEPGKALLHSTPTFEVTPPVKRIVDVYDCLHQ